MSSVPASRSFDKAEETGAGLARSLPKRHSQVAQTQQHKQRDHDEQAYRRADPQIFTEQHRHHANQQKAVAEDLDDKLGEKAGHCIDVAVNALYHFAGRMLLVEREIQAQAVLRQVPSQSVGRSPTYIFRQNGTAYRRHLLDDGNGNEQERQAREKVNRATGQRRIQQSTHDQGVDKLKE